MRLSGGEIIARSLKEYGVTHVAGIPVHGNWTLADAFNQNGSDLRVIQVMHPCHSSHASVRACVRACEPVCERARACVRAFERQRAAASSGSLG